MFTTIDSICYIPCSGARQRALASEGRRPDVQYFCGTGLHDSVPSTVTISRYLRRDDELIQPQKSHDPLSRVHA
jgi:hypothetical protein